MRNASTVTTLTPAMIPRNSAGAPGKASPAASNAAIGARIGFSDMKGCPSSWSLCLDSEQLGRGAAQHGNALVVAESRRVHDVAHRVLVPGNRMVGADDELARPDFGGEMPQHFGGEDERVVVHGLHVLGRLLLQFDLRVAMPRRDAARVVRARRVRRQEAAAMRGADLEAGKAVERAFEDEMREADRRIERIAYRVGEPAVALEALAELRGALRMDEDQNPELFRLCPERMKLLFRELLSGDARSDGRSAQSEFLDAMLELLHGEVRILERHRGKSDETLRVLRAHFGELVVLYPDYLGGEVALRPVPEGIDAQRLDIDALSVHVAYALGPHLVEIRELVVLHLLAHHRVRFRHDT